MHESQIFEIHSQSTEIRLDARPKETTQLESYCWWSTILSGVFSNNMYIKGK